MPIKLSPLALALTVIAGTAAAQTMMPVDADDDGKISQTEVVNMATARFAMLDANGDGTLTQTEFVQNFVQGFDVIDADGDDMITRKEIRAKAREVRAVLGVAH
ncbi:EF-hand domain-containing protein [Actibacterium sp. D379-3]